MLASSELTSALEARLGLGAGSLQLIGEGAWSLCFAFQHPSAARVVRFAEQVEDFRKDAVASGYSAAGLKIPNVLEIGPLANGYFAVSERIYGIALESLDQAGWRAAVPALAAALEVMRQTDVSATVGFGGWGSDANAEHASWSAYLLAVQEDPPQGRTHGWRARLATSQLGSETFAWGMDKLGELAFDRVPRSLIHGDLINRNVFVDKERVSGVLDWGCSAYGDHLYDLAWLEFWSPWYPELELGLLHAELARRWAASGYRLLEPDRRRSLCYLHIGLDHLAYNAYLGDWINVERTAERMRQLVKAA